MRFFRFYVRKNVESEVVESKLVKQTQMWVTHIELMSRG